MIDASEPTPPTYEQLLAENGRLRHRVAELEGSAASRAKDDAPPVPKVKLHKLDPNAADAFRRPAYSRRSR